MVAKANQLNHTIPYVQQLSVLARRRQLKVHGLVGDPYYHVVSLSSYVGDVVIDASRSMFKPGDKVVIEYSHVSPNLPGVTNRVVYHVINPATGAFEDSHH